MYFYAESESDMDILLLYHLMLYNKYLRIKLHGSCVPNMNQFVDEYMGPLGQLNDQPTHLGSSAWVAILIKRQFIRIASYKGVCQNVSDFASLCLNRIGRQSGKSEGRWVVNALTAFIPIKLPIVQNWKYENYMKH